MGPTPNKKIIVCILNICPVLIKDEGVNFFNVATDEAIQISGPNAKKSVGILFSQGYDKKCEDFSNNLIQWYNKDLAKKGLEIVLVSTDSLESFLGGRE